MKNSAWATAKKECCTLGALRVVLLGGRGSNGQSMGWIGMWMEKWPHRARVERWWCMRIEGLEMERGWPGVSAIGVKAVGLGTVGAGGGSGMP